MGDEKCFFDWKFGCASKSEKLIVAGPVRIKNIIRHSILYGDEKTPVIADKLGTVTLN